MTKFITISSDPTAWGDTTADPNFSVDDTVQQLSDAAEANGIEVLLDEYPRVLYDVDGHERDQIDWFTTWCCEGWQWGDAKWREFFHSYVTPKVGQR